MKTVLADLFERFVADIASKHAACLVAELGQAAEVGAKVKSPVSTVVVRGRRNGAEEPLAVVLMTTPATAADDPALLDFIVRRARANKTPYFITWTLRDAILWATPKPGIPAARGSIDKVRDYPDLYEIVPAEEAIIDEPTKLKILERGHEILHDLERLLKDEASGLVQVDATYFVGRLLNAVHRFLSLVADSLLLRLQTDHSFRGEMAVWAVRQGIAGDPQDPEFARSIARQIIYRLLGKVLFYQSLRRVARQLPDLDLRGVDSAQVIPTLRAAFARALEIDYYAVFAEDLPDRIQWPAEASRELAALIQDFHTRDFSHVPQDVIGAVFEQLIPPEERHGLGQYFTPENLCDLIIGFCVRSPTDCVLDAAARWGYLRGLAGHIEHAGRKYAKTHPLGTVTEEDDHFRVRVLRQGEMLAELQREGKTVKWGRYLRAPQVYFDMLREGKLCLLREIATPRFGSKTQINEFFHVTPEVAEQFGIEEEYLLPLIKRPKETNTITVDPAELKLRIFVCRRSKAELRKLGHKGALKYIEWGEQQTYASGPFEGLTWPEGTWVKSREPGWWALPKNEFQSAHVFYTAALSDKHAHRYCRRPLVADKRLYFLAPRGRLSPELFAAVLNCTISAICCEVTGRVTMGDGVLEVVVEEARDYLLIPDIRHATATAIKRIANSFALLLDREVESAIVEVTREDRMAFDREVLSAIGLDPRKYLKPLYEGLCELVRERIELGRMRGKARKTKARGEKAAAKVAEAVLDEVLPHGPRRFPDDCLSPAAAAGPKTPVELPDQPLVFENTPMFMGVHVQGGSFDRHVRSPAEGKFLLYAQQAGQKVAQIPEKTVEVTRTVANYEKYLRELHAQLYEAYYRRTLDTRTAARLTQAAFERFHLPSPDGV